MNDNRATGIGKAELRLALRGLRRDEDPGRDLWPGIAARVALSGNSAQPAMQATARQGVLPLATAAVLLLAVGLLGWQAQVASSGSATDGVRIAIDRVDAREQSTPVQREADAMTVHYQAALREFEPQAIPAGWQQGLAVLDRSAVEIRNAMRRDPGSRLLLERLRATYTRRLALSRRALHA